MRYVNRAAFAKRHAKELEPIIRRAKAAARRLTSQVPPSVSFVWDPAILQPFRPLLIRLFESKCAYCETPVGDSIPGDIDQYRPWHEYPWLAYEWQNLLLTCAVCNQRYKSDRFPVKGVRASKPGEEINEAPLLLNPTVDDPAQHLTFVERETGVRAVGLTERGRTSISVLGLNRESLIAARLERWVIVEVALQQFVAGRVTASTRKLHPKTITFLRNVFSRDTEYIGSIRRLALEWLEGRGIDTSAIGVWDAADVTVSTVERKDAEQKTEALREELGAYSLDTVESVEGALQKFDSAAKRIERIQVHNLRAIRDLDILVPATGTSESWIMAIGENGVGKSSLLQGIALALMGQSRANKRRLNAADFVRRDATDGKGFVKVFLSSIGPIELKFSKGSRKFEVTPPDPKVPLLAYGPTRLLPRETGRAPLEDRNIRIENLFDPTVPLCNAEQWLVRLRGEDVKTFRSIGRALCRLLMLKDTPAPRIKDNRLMVATPDGWRPLRELSDGYQSMIALVVDIAIGATGTRRMPEEAEGIVILDEIEVHLHPRWKISIVDRFRKVFPKLCFIATTHDPLCLKGLREDEILVLRRDERGRVSYTANLPSVHEMRTDEILTSDLFELPSSRNNESAVTIARYSTLLNKPSRTKKEEAELEALRGRINATMANALTPMQRDVERALASVMRQLRNGKKGRELTHDVVAEIRRQVSQGRGDS